jgi:hypothetical protein
VKDASSIAVDAVTETSSSAN